MDGCAKAAGCTRREEAPWSRSRGRWLSRSAYAGWGGSLPADVAQQRLQQALVLAELSPEEFVGALLPTMFSPATPPEVVEGPTSRSRRCWCTATRMCGHIVAAVPYGSRASSSRLGEAELSGAALPPGANVGGGGD